MVQKVVSMEAKLLAVFSSGVPLKVTALCRDLEISRQTLYKYRRRFERKLQAPQHDAVVYGIRFDPADLSLGEHGFGNRHGQPSFHIGLVIGRRQVVVHAPSLADRRRVPPVPEPA